MNWVERFLNNLKIKHKLLTIYLVAGIIPLILLASYTAYRSYSSIIGEHQHVLESENKRIRSVLFDVTYLVSNASLQLQADKDLTGLLSAAYETEDDVYRAYRAYPTLDFLVKSYSEISKIYLYSTNPSLVTSGHFQRVTEDISHSAWYRKAEESGGEIFWAANTDIDPYSQLTLVRKLRLDTSGNFAVLAITVSDYFLNYINDGSQISSILTLNGQDILFSSDSGLPASFPQLEFSGSFREKEHLAAAYRGKDSLIYGTDLRAVYGEDTFQIISINSEAVASARDTALRYLVILALAMTLPLLLILLFVNNLSSRVNLLREQMKNITEQNYDVRTLVLGKDELGLLFDDMLHTIHSIKKLNAQIYTEKLEKQRLRSLQDEMRFELLASQINPHFLFNSLETIHMKAETNEDYEVSYLSELLGQLLRYSLDVKDRPSPLSGELDYLDHYLRFQKIRFDDSLDYKITLSPQIDPKRYEILPMLIQPLVENAILHGFHDKAKNCRVEIRVWADASFLYITVSDNGAGMEENALLELTGRMSRSLEEEETAEVRHIGLSNIYHRIKLFYGENYTISPNSMAGQGTTFTLYLPPPDTGAETS